MDHTLTRIKRAVLAGRYEFTFKAILELDAGGLQEQDVAEAILNAARINKKLRSDSVLRARDREILYVIIGENLDGVSLYTKGKLVGEPGDETYYVLVSSKRSAWSD